MKKLILIFAICAALSRGLTAAIQFDAASNSGAQTTVTSASWSHTCTGSNLALAVAVNQRTTAGNYVLSVTYNGVPLTPVSSGNNSVAYVSLWVLTAPPTGAHNVVVTLSAAPSTWMAAAISLTGVDQGIGADAVATVATGTSSTPSVSLTSIADNSWVVDAVQGGNGATPPSALTAGGSQANSTSIDETGGRFGGMSTQGPKTPAGPVTMGWTFTGGATLVWAHAAASFKPAGAAAQRAYITSGTSWAGVPTDGSAIKVEAIGGGGGGSPAGGNVGTGGGGGAYAVKVVAYTSSATISGITIGTGGASNGDGTDTKWNSGVVIAKAGCIQPALAERRRAARQRLGRSLAGRVGGVGSNVLGGAGGGGAGGRGGAGLAGGVGGAAHAGSGGGGAGGQSATAGILGSGGTGGNGGVAQDGTAGGAGSSASATPGGNGSHGSGGGGGGWTSGNGSVGGNGGNGLEFDASVYGSGGGGGGGSGGTVGVAGGNGGTYGGGGGGGGHPTGPGGVGGAGIIVVTYTPAAAGGGAVRVIHRGISGGLMLLLFAAPAIRRVR